MVAVLRRFSIITLEFHYASRFPPLYEDLDGWEGVYLLCTHVSIHSRLRGWDAGRHY
jgi:hypothetical protein